MRQQPISIAFIISCLLTITSCSTAPRPEEPPPPPRVLILGDSISIAYTPLVREFLGGKAVVIRPTNAKTKRAENCAGTTKGVGAIDRWLALDGGNFDVIHFNFGLHDLKCVHPKTGRGSNNPSHPKQASLEVYTRQLRAITERLLSTGATLIFATTTPVPTGGVRPHRIPEDVNRYNAAAKAIMDAHGIGVNDLYAFALPQLASMQRPKDVHFLPLGSKALGMEVVKSILRASHKRN